MVMEAECHAQGGKSGLQQHTQNLTAPCAALYLISSDPPCDTASPLPHAGAMLKCYGGLSPSPKPLIIVNTTTSKGAEITPATMICIRYSSRCTAIAELDCTPEEIAEIYVWKWQYSQARAADCEQLTLLADTSDMYKDVTCCAEDYCNSPFPALQFDG
jgi:hypothetical protein